MMDHIYVDSGDREIACVSRWTVRWVVWLLIEAAPYRTASGATRGSSTRWTQTSRRPSCSATAICERMRPSPCSQRYTVIFICIIPAGVWVRERPPGPHYLTLSELEHVASVYAIMMVMHISSSWEVQVSGRQGGLRIPRARGATSDDWTTTGRWPNQSIRDRIIPAFGHFWASFWASFGPTLSFIRLMFWVIFCESCRWIRREGGPDTRRRQHLVRHFIWFGSVLCWPWL